MKLLHALTIVVLTVAVPASGYAATVWGKISYWDSRTHRGGGSSNHRLGPIGSNKNTALPYAYIFVWDKDGDCQDVFSSCSENDDDLLGYDVANASGYFYLYNVGTAEDVYLVFTYQAVPDDLVKVRGIAYGAPVTITVATESVTDIGGDYRRDWNVTCWDDDVDCTSQTHVDVHYPSYEAYALILASMIDTTRWAGPVSYNGFHNIIGYWPDGPDPGDCSSPAAAHATGYDEFCVANGFQTYNHYVAHEMGHLVMKRLLDDIPGTLADGSSCATWTGWAEEKCATSEGFADFFAAATFWTPSASDAYLDNNQVLEGYTTAGNTSQSKCVSLQTNPHRRRGNVVRWFWDLYDSTTVGDNGNDSKTYSINTIKA